VVLALLLSVWDRSDCKLRVFEHPLSNSIVAIGIAILILQLP
jgi:hypothetical protein